MKVHKNNEDSYGIHIEDDDKGFPEISLFRDTDIRTMKKKDWEINWASIGGVDVETAEKFCSALQKAIKFVKEGGDEKHPM